MSHLFAINDRNINWKGDDVGYHGVHAWIRRHLPKPLQCQNCNEIKRLDIACISGIYSRDISNYKYLCRKCHKILDQQIDMSSRICSNCGNNKTQLVKSNGRPKWFYDNDRLICSKCYQKRRRSYSMHSY